MSYRIEITDLFEKQLKKLSKKYPSIKEDYSSLIKSLTENPKQGIPIGNNCYKVRMAIKSKGKGKSAGARIITYIVVSQTTLYLLSIYDKSEQENITEKDLENLLKFIE